MLQSVAEPMRLDLQIQATAEVVELHRDGVVHLFWQPGRTVDAADARAAVAAVDRISCGGRYPLLMDVSRTDVVRHEARSIFTKPWPASRVALLDFSPADKFVATLFLRAGTTMHPTRFFTSRSETMSWLSTGQDERAAG
jgi:hypothetical protein